MLTSFLFISSGIDLDQTERIASEAQAAAYALLRRCTRHCQVMLPNKSTQRSRTLVMRCCQLSTPANSKAFSASATVLRAHPAVSATALDALMPPQTGGNIMPRERGCVRLS
jgi:hypothetical protein